MVTYGYTTYTYLMSRFANSTVYSKHPQIFIPVACTERRDDWKDQAISGSLKLAPRASIFHPFNIFYNCDNEQLSDHGVTFLYLQQSLALQDLQTNVSRVNYYGHQWAFRILKIHSAYKFQNHPSMITCTTISNFSMLHTQHSVRMAAYTFTLTMGSTRCKLV